MNNPRPIRGKKILMQATIKRGHKESMKEGEKTVPDGEKKKKPKKPKETYLLI